GFRLYNAILFSVQGITFDGNAGGKKVIKNDSSADVLVDDCVFQYFSQTNDGNGVYQRQGGSATITNSSFFFNGSVGSCCNKGGAVCADGGTVTISQCHFEGNQAANGGAVAGRDADVFVDNSLFIYNVAGHDGGAIYVDNGSLTVDQAQFHFNTSSDWGGAAWTSGFSNFVSKSDFCGNYAGIEGGAIALANSVGLTDISNTRLWENESNNGSAIFASPTGLAPLYVTQNTFAANGFTPAIYGDWNADLIASNNLFVDHLDYAMWTNGPWTSLNNGFWNNAFDTNWGGDTTDVFADPRLLSYVPYDGLCDDQLIPDPLSLVNDAGNQLDLDGSPSMLGATGGPGADPALWADSDADGQPAMWDCDDTDASIQRETWWLDGDGDGLGDPNSAASTCSPSAISVQNADDCDDDDASTGVAQRWYADDDGDGYGSDLDPGTVTCTPSGTVSSIQGDCNDAAAFIHIDGIETCGDGMDTDCDGAGGPNDDEDGDGVSWLHESVVGGDDCNPDTDGDGLNDGDEFILGDSDGDGDYDLADFDDDNDGINTVDEGTGDRDEGGGPNYVDSDADGDGVADAAERADHDGDGIPDYLQDGGDGIGSSSNAEPNYGFGCNTSGAPIGVWWLLLPLLGLRRDF
ncbi:MAG: hypothetical protein GWP91_14015, partial [Rhodobacterales bacterium]|nr:hypothetical protein [Rhodobacterales bacterium]